MIMRYELMLGTYVVFMEAGSCPIVFHGIQIE